MVLEDRTGDKMSHVEEDLLAKGKLQIAKLNEFYRQQVHVNVYNDL